eukprot:GFUD01002431.1.p1 GENE.GFUD01002431.1~~GFUD01002431.1.p1  ORF type:complete len:307 (-),score=99.47 GFUD01002431.1:415-1266(-)
MSCEDEVLAIRKKLEKMTGDDSDQTQALDMLNCLGKLDINLQILTSTRIGMTVNALRKSSKEDEIITVAKSLIKTWKKFVPDSGEKKPEKPKEEHREEKKVEKKPTNMNSRGESFSGDEVRSRCRELLLAAIKGDGVMPEGVDEDKCGDLATSLESEIFGQYKQTNAKYKNQVRSRVFNLKDKKNPGLRQNLLLAILSPERLAKMTSEEMANDDTRSEREKFTKEGIDASRLAIVEGTTTDLLKCGKCNKRNCTYNQIQTRSADEPMTTFVLCNECGNRWKFC